MGRLGGSGLSDAQITDIIAYLDSLERPRVRPARDAEQAARGRKLFQSKEVGCAGCHGGPMLTNGSEHEFGGDLPKADTPSLIGLAASAPYFHDGSAATLRAALMGNGTVHNMGHTDKLSPAQLDDLIAYLETL
jgi:cytochrome c peroxidase